MARKTVVMKFYALSALKSAAILTAIVIGGLALGAGLSQMVRAAEAQTIASSTQAAVTTSAAQDVKAWLRNTKSLKAGFLQQGADGQLVRGTFTLQQPGQLRFEYEPSVELLIVADNGSIYFIDYEVNQVSRYPIDETPLAPLLSVDGIAGLELDAIEVTDGPMAGTIAVTSKDPKHREYGTLTMLFDRTDAQGGLSLRSWTVLDGQGNLTQITLQNPMANVDVADNIFKFKDPRPRGPRKR